VISFLLIAATAILYSQTNEIAPQVIPQGGIVRVHGHAGTETARMNGHTIRLFPESDGTVLGLMPIAANEKPGEYRLELFDKTGTIIDSVHVTVRDAHFPVQNIIISKQLSELKPSLDETENVAAFRNAVSDIRHWTEPLTIALPVSGCLTSPFGVKRLHNGKPTGDYHAGFDQRSPAGGPIRAVADGIVKIARQYNLHGGTVAIDHGQGVESIYLHMSKFATTEGAIVHKGDIIGYVGSTGRSTGPHLHWSIYVNGTPVNPTQWVHVAACTTAKR
jgi:murein DD-endopeptidase MepM/ murein hydrolase activator NlpD